ncbi:LuxR family transcriptional regulator [bacterium SCGC AG-212-C10]|nr:LuxR family transcriptional regulator [bacterium SCGC AG-212-C10]
MRIVLADDSVLLREGLRRILTEAGFDIVSVVNDAQDLLGAVASHQPDIAVVDIRMPPTFTNEGAVAAVSIREQWPDVAILLLSQSIESSHALSLARHHPARFGYLLKDRVLEVAMLLEAIERIANGGTVLDPEIVSTFLGRKTFQDRLGGLTQRERDVLALMAEGRSNRGVASALVVNEKTVETHVARIFSKLGLAAEPDDHRRVLAVRAWLLPGNDLPPSSSPF